MAANARRVRWKDKDFCILTSHKYETCLVTLFIRYESEQKIEGAHITGFLFHHQNIPIWITAGHAMEDFKKLLASSVQIKQCHFIDCAGGGGQTIPIDRNDIRPVTINRDGVDISIVILPGYVFKTLFANERNYWLNAPKPHHLKKPKPIGFHLVGWPKILERNSKWHISKHVIELSTQLTLICLPIKRISGRKKSSNSFWNRKGGFYGRILPYTNSTKLDLESIVGMSGGPIFAIQPQKDGSFNSRLYGIQSGWLASTGEIYATHISTVTAIACKVRKQLKSLIKKKHEKHLPPAE